MSKEKFKRFAARFIQDHRRAGVVRWFARAARFYSDAWEHPSYEITENGEHAMLRALSGENIRTVFDVGANVGDWSSLAKEIFKSPAIYAFEPVPDTFRELAGRIGGGAGSHALPYGLSDKDDEVEFTYYGAENSFLSTMATPIHDHLPSTRVKIQLRNGDAVVRELGVDRIDFLKIDVEGMELEVLEGLRETLAARKIGIIQFEKQPGRRLLKDYFVLLEGLGFRVGKIFSRYVEFRPYDSLQERTAGPNYLAVQANRTDLIRALERGTL